MTTAGYKADILFSFVISALSIAGCRSPHLPSEPGPARNLIVLKNRWLSFEFDGTTGLLKQAKYRGRVFLRNTRHGASIGFQSIGENGKHQWVSIHDLPDRARLVSYERKPAGGVCRLELITDIGVWRLTDEWDLHRDSALLVRRGAVEYRGDGTPRIKGAYLSLPGLRADGRGFYAFPQAFPPRKVPFSALCTNPALREKSGRYRNWPKEFGRQAELAALCWKEKHETLLAFCFAKEDYGGVAVVEKKDSLNLSHGFQSWAWMARGARVTFGDQIVAMSPAPFELALAKVHTLFSQVGFVPPTNQPEWLRKGVIYALNPGSIETLKLFPMGGAARAARYLPYIRSLGATAIWSWPLQDEKPYWPRDYYRLARGVGTVSDVRNFVSAAHKIGMKVLFDFVPHGGFNDNARARAHPEWLKKDLQGKVPRYGAFDYAHPRWQDYLMDVARYNLDKFAIDGFRVDVAAGGWAGPNWNRDLIGTGRHASSTYLRGGSEILRRLRSATKQRRPEAAVLAESNAVSQSPFADLFYDFHLAYPILRHLPDALDRGPFVRDLQQWLEFQKAISPPGFLWMRFTQSPDMLSADRIYGLNLSRALFAVCALIEGVPLLRYEQEIGSGFWLQSLLHVRQAVPELRDGQAQYNLPLCDVPGVFHCLRTKGRFLSIPLINLTALSCRAAVRLPEAEGKAGLAAYEPFRGERIVPVNGKVAVDFAPYEARVLILRNPSEIPKLRAGLRTREAKSRAPSTRLRAVRVSNGLAVQSSSSGTALMLLGPKTTCELAPSNSMRLKFATGRNLARLVFPEATEWFVATAEGNLYDRVIHRFSAPRLGWWRKTPMNVL